MSKLFVASVGTVQIFDGDTYLGRADTYTDTSMSVEVSKEDVRAGQGAKLIGKFFHSPIMNLTLTNQVLDFNVLAKNFGSAVTLGSDVSVTEQVTLGAGGAGTLTGESPVAFGDYGIVGFVTPVGEENYTKVTFSGTGNKDFTYASGSDGDVVCVTYFYNNNAAKVLTVSSNIIPSTVRLTLRMPLFYGEETDAENATEAGFIDVVVPRFQFDGTVEIALSMAGVSTVPLTGSALSVSDGTSCTIGGYYAKIIEVIENANWYDSANGLLILNGEIELAAAETETLDVRYTTSFSLPQQPPYADLTFTSDTPATATVSTAGVVTAVGAGTTLIKAKITSKPEIEAFILVTVS